MNTFKHAEMIELHDAGIVLQPDGSDPRLGWREFDLHGESFLVDDEDVGTFMGAFGLEYDRGMRVHRLRTRIGSGQPLDGLESSQRIRTLLARCEGPHLLSIRAELIREAEQGGVESQWQEISYSGSYSIWWTPSGTEAEADHIPPPG